MIYVSAPKHTDLEALKDEVRSAVRRNHHLPPGSRDDVETTDLGSLSKLVDKVVLGVTALLASIALISLLVGGIGIMNTMLVSMIERTHEIGLRMAVGATENHILLQFLTEAMALSCVGGLIGIALGLGLSAGVTRHLEWPVALSGISVVVALALSLVFGAFFGLYPAWRASKLNPIEALRNE